MKATMLLCDFAEEVGGKLYIMGGGWSRLKRPRVPTTMCLAVNLSISWGEVEAVHKLKAELVTSDNETVTLDGSAVRVVGNLQQERDSASTASRAIPTESNFVLRFDGLVLDPGVYSWTLEVDDNLMASVPFLVPEEDETADEGGSSS
jgi:hypothetical protein